MGLLPEGRGILSNLVRLLKQFGQERALGNGRHLHHHICCIGYDTSRFLANWIIRMYGECGCMEDAQAVFDGLYCQNTHSWSILVTMYGQNGRLENAKAVFESIPERTVVPWNAMMTACIQNGLRKNVAALFCRMMLEAVQFDKVTLVSVVDACSSMEEGKHLHVFIAGSGCTQDLNVRTALLTMYGRCGRVKYANAIFKDTVDPDLSCWNAMMAAFSQNQHGKEALNLFSQMQFHVISPDVISFVCALDGCASLSSLEAGHAIHASVLETAIEVGGILGTALVDMYGKCGSIPDAFRMFSISPHDNLISWNAVVAVFAQNGHGIEAISLFSQMQNDCIKPDYSTYISVLKACSHGGLISLGWYYFSTMHACHGIEHTVDHYACMVDLLGRAGCLDEAEHLLDRIPSKVDDVTWRALLHSYKIHFDVDCSMGIANKRLALDPEDAALYTVHASVSSSVQGEMFTE